MFLHLSVSHSVHGVCASVHVGIYTRPKQTPPPGADTPLVGDTPEEHIDPYTVHAGKYGQQAGGTHPTGMHNCN